MIGNRRLGLSAEQRFVCLSAKERVLFSFDLLNIFEHNPRGRLVSGSISIVEYLLWQSTLSVAITDKLGVREVRCIG